MSLRQIGLLLLVTCGMSAGQVLFKFAAERSKTSSLGFLPGLATNPVFIIAIALYGAVTLLWVYILSTMKLSTAYPFMAISFVVTPLLASFFFSEPLGLRYWVAMCAIMLGILLVPQR